MGDEATNKPLVAYHKPGYLKYNENLKEVRSSWSPQTSTHFRVQTFGANLNLWSLQHSDVLYPPGILPHTAVNKPDRLNTSQRVHLIFPIRNPLHPKLGAIQLIDVNLLIGFTITHTSNCPEQEHLTIYL